MNLKNLFLVTLALILVVLVNRLAEEGVKQVDKRLATEPGMQQDYYLNDFSVTALDEKGQPQHRLQANQLSHFSNGVQTELRQPTLEVYRQGKVEWRVVAERGEFNPQQDEVLLQGKVKLLQSSGTAPLQLTTSSLRIQPQQGRAETDQPVTLIQAKNRIDAIGMEIDQQKQRLRLLSKVRGHYATLAH